MEVMSYYSSTKLNGASESGTHRYNPCGLDYYLFASVLTVRDRFQGKTTNESPLAAHEPGIQWTWCGATTAKTLTDIQAVY